MGDREEAADEAEAANPQVGDHQPEKKQEETANGSDWRSLDREFQELRREKRSLEESVKRLEGIQWRIINRAAFELSLPDLEAHQGPAGDPLSARSPQSQSHSRSQKEAEAKGEEELLCSQKDGEEGAEAEEAKEGPLENEERGAEEGGRREDEEKRAAAEKTEPPVVSDEGEEADFKEASEHEDGGVVIQVKDDSGAEAVGFEDLRSGAGRAEGEKAAGRKKAGREGRRARSRTRSRSGEEEPPGSSAGGLHEGAAKRRKREDGYPIHRRADARSRALFGNLLSHLKSAKSRLESERSSKVAEMREKVEERLLEKSHLTRLGLQEQRKEKIEKEIAQAKARMDEIDASIRDREPFLLQRRLENHYTTMKNFIRTEAEPTIFWLPAKHNASTQLALEATAAQLEAKIQSLAGQLMPPSPEQVAEQALRAKTAVAALAAMEAIQEL